MEGLMVSSYLSNTWEFDCSHTINDKLSGVKHKIDYTSKS